jgi:hypothetical protein
MIPSERPNVAIVGGCGRIVAVASAIAATTGRDPPRRAKTATSAVHLTTRSDGKALTSDFEDI